MPRSSLHPGAGDAAEIVLILVGLEPTQLLPVHILRHTCCPERSTADTRPNSFQAVAQSGSKSPSFPDREKSMQKVVSRLVGADQDWRPEPHESYLPILVELYGG
jgi:hypothetical protein